MSLSGRAARGGKVQDGAWDVEGGEEGRAKDVDN